MRKIFVRFLWTIFVLAVIGAAVCFWAIAEGRIGYMPPIEDLQNPISRFATQIYSSDGKLIGTWNMNRENRVMVTYSQLPPSLVQALVATEDARFYEHSGIDFKALGRAVIKRGLLGQKSAGGGSTITQQLAKQLFSDVAHSTTERMLQKPIEWVIAVQLERNYTKDEIITMYLNYFDFLHNAVGIKTASNTYFSKEPANLTLTESATLVGLCKNPSYYNPVRFPERSQQRRNIVLGQMLKEGYITQQQHDSCCQEPIGLRFHVNDHKEGIATYFRDFLRRYLMANEPIKSDYPAWNYVKYVMDSIAWEEDPLYGWCNKNTKRDGQRYNVYTDGLKVYTTIDSRMQQYAEEACWEHVVNFLQPAFVKANKSKKNAPYSSNLSANDVKKILQRSIRQCDRYRVMKSAGFSEKEIEQAFKKPVKMSVYTYHGDVDTIMTPLDSIRYYKSFLRTGFFSMEPQTGQVRAYVGGLDFEHFTYDMATEGRRQVEELMNFFHKYVPGCEKATLMGTGSTMGIRESRHVHGDFVLPVQDLIDGVIPDDNILLSANSIDVHGAMGGPAGGLYMPIQKDMYGVPYRCLLPAGVGGLLLAGRCISADSAAAGAIRVMPPAMAIGQAAGTAAALCLLNGTTPSSLDYADLRKSLLEQNVFLG